MRRCKFCRRRVRRRDRIPGPVYCHRWCFIPADLNARNEFPQAIRRADNGPSVK